MGLLLQIVTSLSWILGTRGVNDCEVVVNTSDKHTKKVLSIRIPFFIIFLLVDSVRREIIHTKKDLTTRGEISCLSTVLDLCDPLGQTFDWSLFHRLTWCAKRKGSRNRFNWSKRDEKMISPNWRTAPLNDHVRLTTNHE